MAKRTVPYNKGGIGKLPENKPALYRIKTEGGKTNYVGVAKRGRIQDRIKEHLPGGKDFVPGTKVQIEQTPSIDSAEKKEGQIISRIKPKYNEQGK